MKNTPNINPKQEAFMTLYKPIHDRLCRFVRSMVWDKEDARDIINETTLKVFERFEHIDNKERFISYVFATASNLCKKQYRLKRFKGFFNWEIASEEEAWQHSESSLQHSELIKILAILSFEQRRAFLLHELSGFSYEEICMIEKCSLSAIKSRIHSAKINLRNYLQQDEITTHFNNVKSLLL
jgi:RNA polymerase sigma-70 factor, ECF subfamily